MNAKKLEDTCKIKIQDIKDRIARKKGTALFEEDAVEVFEIRDVKFPISFSGATKVKRTPLGWKTACGRCGALIKFNRDTLETSGPANKPSIFKEVAVGYAIARDTNQLAADIENGKIDWIEFLRRQRHILYDSARYPSTLSGTTSIRLTCEKCSGQTSISVAVGDDVEIKSLPKDIEALIRLGITKEDSKQFFQLRVGKLADDFVKGMMFSEKELQQLENVEKKVKAFCNNIETDSNIVSNLLFDITSATHTSVLQKTKELKEWQQAQVAEVDRRMFPMTTL